MRSEETHKYRNLAGNESLVFEARVAGIVARKRKRPRLIDLFCGAGGLTLGFTKRFGHCFQPVWANDVTAPMVETYNANFGNHCIGGDIAAILTNRSIDIPEADVVIGGPPCQGFSLLNKNRKNDPRKQLWRPFLEIVRLSKASVFLMENVPPLLKSSELEEIEEAAQKMGFQTAHKVLCAADFGVPQKRFRAFVLGCKGADPYEAFPPRKTHYNPLNGGLRQVELHEDEYTENPATWPTVSNVIADLDSPAGTEIRNEPVPYNLHFGRNPTPKSMARYNAIPEQGMNRFDLQERAPELTPDCWIRKKTGGTDLFGRLWWDRPALTIRTEFFKPEKGRYLHPDQHRPITHREAARIQTFPDDFHFCGSKVQIATQIGNAVPPLLSSRVADSVYALWLLSKD